MFVLYLQYFISLFFMVHLMIHYYSFFCSTCFRGLCHHVFSLACARGFEHWLLGMTIVLLYRFCTIPLCPWRSFPFFSLGEIHLGNEDSIGLYVRGIPNCHSNDNEECLKKKPCSNTPTMRFFIYSRRDIWKKTAAYGRKMLLFIIYIFFLSTFSIDN